MNNFGRAVRDRLGRGLGREILAEKPAIAGQCRVIGSGGRIVDDLPCRRTWECQGANKCAAIFSWPSGARTVVSYRGKTPYQINGKVLRQRTVAGTQCFENRSTRNTFCFLANEAVSTDDRVGVRNTDTAQAKSRSDPYQLVPQETVPRAENEALNGTGGERSTVRSLLSDLMFPKPDQGAGEPRSRSGGVIAADMPAGHYDFVGSQQCGPQTKTIMLSLSVEPSGIVRANIADKEVPPDGRLRLRYLNDYNHVIGLVARKGRVLTFVSPDQRRTAYLRGSFVDQGTSFQGEWLHHPSTRHQDCGAFRLDRTRSAEEIYADLSARLSNPAPNLSDARAVVELEAKRPPQRFLLANRSSNRLQTSGQHGDYKETYSAFWQRLREREANRIASFADVADEQRGAQGQAIADLLLLDAQHSGSIDKAAAFGASLITLVKDGHYLAGEHVEPLAFSSMEEACYHLAAFSSQQGTAALVVQFGLPLEYWDEPQQRNFQDRIRACAEQMPAKGRAFQNVAANLAAELNEISMRRANHLWLQDQAAAMLALDPGYAALEKTNSYSIAANVLRTRGINQSLYARFFEPKVAARRNEAERQAQIEIDQDVREIHAAFLDADPLGASGDNAIRLCSDRGSSPPEIQETCRTLLGELKADRGQALCQRGIDDLSVSDEIQDREIDLRPYGDESITLGQFVCRLAQQKPDWRFHYQSSGLQFWKDPQLTIKDESGSVIQAVWIKAFEVEDDRDVVQYLFEVATGKNEERDFTRYRLVGDGSSTSPASIVEAALN